MSCMTFMMQICGCKVPDPEPVWTEEPCWICGRIERTLATVICRNCGYPIVGEKCYPRDQEIRCHHTPAEERNWFLKDVKTKGKGKIREGAETLDKIFKER